jgi:hypothetical protein
MPPSTSSRPKRQIVEISDSDTEPENQPPPQVKRRGVRRKVSTVDLTIDDDAVEVIASPARKKASSASKSKLQVRTASPALPPVVQPDYEDDVTCSICMELFLGEHTPVIRHRL